MPSQKEIMFGTSKKYFNCIDLHCGGEPARILISGCPPIPGSTMAEKRKELMENYDYIRQLLLQEPRGYPCQNLNLIFPSVRPEADFGYVIAEQNCIYPLFSGHNTICVVTALLESGMIGMCEPMTHFNLESPGGLVKVVAECQGGQVKSVNLESMPSFVGYMNKKVFVKSLNDDIYVDCAFGGMWYVIVQVESSHKIPEISRENGAQLAKLGEEIKALVKSEYPIQHPDLDYEGPDILVFTSDQKIIKRKNDDKENDGVLHGKNTVVMSAGPAKNGRFPAILDRSPCGSGTAAVMANLWQKGKLQIGEPFVHESITGTKFEGELVRRGPNIGKDGRSVETVIPRIKGNAFITAFNTLVVDPQDPFPTGFTISDIWG